MDGKKYEMGILPSPLPHCLLLRETLLKIQLSFFRPSPDIGLEGKWGRKMRGNSRLWRINQTWSIEQWSEILSIFKSRLKVFIYLHGLIGLIGDLLPLKATYGTPFAHMWPCVVVLLFAGRGALSPSFVVAVEYGSLSLSWLSATITGIESLHMYLSREVL